MRRIKNRGKLKKEGFVISILKSERSNAESNYMKHFSINTNVNNNNNDNNDVNNNINNDNDDIYDGKITDIRVILKRLGDIITKNDRGKLKKLG